MSKRTTICKIWAPHFDKKSQHTFMVCVESVEIQNCGTFAEHAANFAKRATIRRTRHIFAAKDAAILGLRHFTRRHTEVRPSKCGARFVEEKQHIRRYVFKCRRGTFVTFFLTYTIGVPVHIVHTYPSETLPSRRISKILTTCLKVGRFLWSAFQHSNIHV